MARGTPWQEIFEGYCDGADEARERHGVDVRFTPDITRDFPVEIADQLVEWAVRFRERGVVGHQPGRQREPLPAGAVRAAVRGRPRGRPQSRAARRRARRSGVGARRPRRAARRPPAARRARRRGPRAARRARRARHRLRRHADQQRAHRRRAVARPSTRCRGMLAAGVPCSISTDDPVLMGTDLDRDCAAAVSLGHTPRGMFEQALSRCLLRGRHQSAPARARRGLRLDVRPEVAVEPRPAGTVEPWHRPRRGGTCATSAPATAAPCSSRAVSATRWPRCCSRSSSCEVLGVPLVVAGAYFGGRRGGVLTALWASLVIDRGRSSSSATCRVGGLRR